MSDGSCTPQPSTSRQALEPNSSTDNIDDVDLTLNIKNENAEIERLELDTNKTETKVETAADDERIAKIGFRCSACEMHELVHYYGKTPPFVHGVKFLEDTYVMRDPFQPPPPRWKAKPEYFIALGSQCVQCERVVCKDAACSFYYTATYCLRCAEKIIKNFPVEAQSKLRKQLLNK